MNTSVYEERFYRHWHHTDGKLAFNVSIDESDCDIMIDPVDDIEIIKDKVHTIIKRVRQDILNFSNLIPEFLTGLEPLYLSDVEVDILCKKAYIKESDVIRSMLHGSNHCLVGPMATVAGVTAQKIVKDLMKEYGNVHIIVENGGDLAMNIVESSSVAIYAGKSVLSDSLAIQLKEKTGPMSICTSSGTFGHSLSFGQADALVVLSKEADIADAAATYLCNQVRSSDDIASVLELGKQIQHISGMVIIVQDKIGLWGEVDLIKRGDSNGM